jgi:hypothetical protein
MDPDQDSSGSRRGLTTTTSTTSTHGLHTTTSTTHSTTDAEGTTVTHYGPHSTTITHPAVTTTTRTPVPQSPAPTASPATSIPQRVRSSSIRIRRPSAQSVLPSPSPQPQPQPQQPTTGNDTWHAGRRRSSSEPRPPSSVLFADDNDLRRQMTATPLQPLYEDGAQKGLAINSALPPPSQGPSTRRQGMQRQISALNIRRNNHHHNHNRNTMDANVVDVLDVIGACHQSR